MAGKPISTMAQRPRHLSPVEYLLHVFGGPTEAQRAIGNGATAPNILRWQHIPSRLMPVILAVAKERGLPIAPQDLILGREVTTEPAKRSA